MKSIKEAIACKNIKFEKIERIQRVKNVTLNYLPKNDYTKKEFKRSFKLATLLGSALILGQIQLHKVVARDKTFEIIGDLLISVKIDDKITELFIT